MSQRVFKKIILFSYMFVYTYMLEGRKGEKGRERKGERISTQESKNTHLLMESGIVWSRRNYAGHCIVHRCKSERKCQTEWPHPAKKMSI